MTSLGGDGTGSRSQAVAAPPSISLPKGGGAIRGLGEKLGANPATGSAKATIPIATSPGRHGFGPRLALTYDSAGGATVFGLGWSLDLPAIARRTDRGVPTYRDPEDSDVFVLAGAEDLVPALARTAAGEWVRERLPPRVVDGVSYDLRRYVPRIEGVFARIERWTSRSDPADDFWRTITADDITTWYGRTPESRVADPEDRARVLRWLICETYDDQGHVAVYRYKEEDDTGVDRRRSHERNRSDAARHGERHLKRVRYGNAQPYLPALEPGARWPEPPGATADDASPHWLFELVLDYGDHPGDAPKPLETADWAPREDPFSSYRAGFEMRTYRRCQRVLMFHHFPDEPAVSAGCLVRSMDFDYSLGGEGPVYSALTRVTQWSHRRSPAGYDRRCLPPLEMAYSEAVVDPTVRELDPDSLEGIPEGVEGARYRFADLDGEGRAGILTEQSGRWAYKRNLSAAGVARFAAPETVDPLPSPPQLVSRQLLDLAGDGRLDVASFTDPAPGFFARTCAGWEPLVAFDSLPTIDWADPNLRFVDLTGDGRADVLITEDDVLRWYPSLGEAGFGAAEATPQALDEERGPRLVFADGTGTVHLADMSGDGLSDLVRIRNGSVCYWPSLGHGRFGAKVAMDHAPWFDAPDRFDERRVLLADIDGSGTVDLIYLSDRGVDLYFNRSGNGWSAAHRLEGFPRIDDVAAVETVDLLGIGTTCLVWSSALVSDASRPLRYVDLMGGRKPHLLTRAANNLGLQTELEYAASTEFSLADRLAGRPWACPLTFPVHVVRRVTVRDAWRGTAFSSTYAYHEGCFDSIEREFRGFGRVEQLDVEDFAAFAAANAGSPSVTADSAFYQAPVETVSWFDTGMRAPSAGEYLAGVGLGGFREPAPTDDVGTADLDAEEWREAGRATKGRLLRNEVYELDGRGRRIRLLSAGRHTAHVRRLQPRAGNPHAVFLVLDSEAVSVEYDLDLGPGAAAADPRVTHSLTLTADEYGHPLETVSVAYGRRGAAAADGLDPAQLATVRALQGEAHIEYTATRFTNDFSAPDARRLRAPFEVRTYELTGIRPAAPDGAFTLAELRGLNLSQLAEIPHHERPSAAARRKRLVEHTRTRYGRDDLRGPLPLGQQRRLGLVHQTCTLALTDAQLDAVFDARMADVVDGARTAREALRDRATSGYLSGPELAAAFAPLVSAAETAGQYWQPSGTAGFPPDAADHFYLPTRYTDAFGASSTVAWDRYDLFARRSTDAVGNTSSVEAFDFRVLSPTMHRDVNGNLREVAFDILGLVVAAAIRGKAGEGDTLAGFDAALTDPDPTAVAAFCSGRRSTRPRRARGCAARPPASSTTSAKPRQAGRRARRPRAASRARCTPTPPRGCRSASNAPTGRRGSSWPSAGRSRRSRAARRAGSSAGAPSSTTRASRSSATSPTSATPSGARRWPRLASRR